jgi:hypothetical protein
MKRIEASQYSAEERVIATLVGKAVKVSCFEFSGNSI